MADNDAPTGHDLYPMPAFEKSLARGIARGLGPAVDSLVSLNATLKNLRDVLIAGGSVQAPSSGSKPKESVKEVVRTELKEIFKPTLLEKALKATDNWGCGDKHCGMCKDTPFSSEELEANCLATNIKMGIIDEYLQAINPACAEAVDEDETEEEPKVTSAKTRVKIKLRKNKD